MLKTTCWGEPSGPNDPSDDRSTGGFYNPAGLGDKASDYVDYLPWIDQEFVKGDINADFFADLADAIISLQVLSGITPTDIRGDYKTAEIDISGNDMIGMEEAVYALQSAAGMR